MVFRETMKQSPSIGTTHHHTPSSLSALFDEFEIEVSEVLLNLPNLVYESESRYRFRIRWGAKRRRSAIDSTPSTPSSWLSPQGESETQRRAKLVKLEATSSPATPLSFSPSESDEKPQRSRKKALNKKTREEWLETIESLTQQKKLLCGELETVKSYHKKLKYFNSELKAKRHELNFGQSFLNQPTLQSLYVEDQDHRPQVQYAAHQQPCIVDDQTVYSSQANGNFQYSHGQMTQVSSLSPGLGLNEINRTSVVGIPDLNLALDDETFGMDSSQPLGPLKALADNSVKAAAAAAAAAEARRRRMVKIKEMKSSIKLPRC